MSTDGNLKMYLGFTVKFTNTITIKRLGVASNFEPEKFQDTPICLFSVIYRGTLKM
jgi:hypothetical protein